MGYWEAQTFQSLHSRGSTSAVGYMDFISQTGISAVTLKNKWQTTECRYCIVNQAAIKAGCVYNIL